MRDILFRGKRLDNGEWIYGDYFKHDKVKVCLTTDDPKTQHCIMCDGFCDWGFEPPREYCEVDPETVSQYTGWNDGHQTKIFENDIVEFVSGTTSHRYLIWWHREGSMLTAVPLDGITFNGSDYWNGKFPQFEYFTFTFMMLDPYGDFRDIKVIGNIIDNPELLEGIAHVW